MKIEDLLEVKTFRKYAPAYDGALFTVKVRITGRSPAYFLDHHRKKVCNIPTMQWHVARIVDLKHPRGEESIMEEAENAAVKELMPQVLEHLKEAFELGVVE